MSGYPGKLNEHAKRTLIERWQRGLPAAEIAVQLNVSRQAVHRWIRLFQLHGWAMLAPEAARRRRRRGRSRGTPS